MKYFIVFCLAVLATASEVDTNTFSNYLDVKLTHMHLEWLLDLEHQYINATSVYDFHVTAVGGVNTVGLDTYQLNVYLVYLPGNGNPLSFSVDVVDSQSLVQGDRLSVQLDRNYAQGETFQLKVKYSIDKRSRAINFLTKAQTLSQLQPYMFSQCETINCRSMVPLQDTPAVKLTYSATVFAKQGLQVFMSGNQTSSSDVQLHGDYEGVDMSTFNTFTFESTIPMPSYLIAIIAGAVVQQQVGPRTYVITEQDGIAGAVEDLSDLEVYLTTLEDYIGAYAWGDYKIVIMPPSFPFGGMENPLLTFASPSIIVGDKSGVSVAIHEIAHSWTGNTVTCVNWSNFWINEGFTVFLERKALSALSGKGFGPDYALGDAHDGNSALQTAINGFEKEKSYSSLHPKTDGLNPDDSFSTVPYEKGFQFLSYLETSIQEHNMKAMLRDYMVHYKYQSIDHLDVQSFFIQWLTANLVPLDPDVINQVTNIWNQWVLTPGMPAFVPNYTSTRILEAQQLAQAYIDSQGVVSPAAANDFDLYFPNQKYVFLQYLIDHQSSVTSAILKLIQTDLMLTDSNNKEIQWRWFTLCLLSNYQIDLENIHQFLGQIGRQKMVLPVYAALNGVNRPAALAYFAEYQSFYHPLALQSINNILNPPTIEIIE